MAGEVLTPAERDLMLEMLSQPVGVNNAQGQITGRVGMVSVAKLAEYRVKDNDVIRAELVVYTSQKKAALQEALVKAQKQVADINAQLG